MQAKVSEITRKSPKAIVVETGTAERSLRRRLIDPTTCEREYRDDELEFMRAIEQYKRTSGRMFPTCSEVLELVRSLGYVRTQSVLVSV